MSVFGSGIRPWKRQTETKRAADSSVPGKGELVVSDTGKVYVPDGTTQAKNLSPLVSKIVADATYALLWQPNTAYAANAPVMLPNGKTATRTSAGTSRPSFDATELAACPYGAHQSIDIATPLSDRATPERNLVQFQGAPAGLGSSTDGVHWSEAAHATAAGLIPVRYGAVVPHI